MNEFIPSACDWCGNKIPNTDIMNSNGEIFCSADCADAIEGCK